MGCLGVTVLLIPVCPLMIAPAPARPPHLPSMRRMSSRRMLVIALLRRTITLMSMCRSDNRRCMVRAAFPRSMSWCRAAKDAIPDCDTDVDSCPLYGGPRLAPLRGVCRLGSCLIKVVTILCRHLYRRAMPMPPDPQENDQPSQSRQAHQAIAVYPPGIEEFSLSARQTVFSLFSERSCSPG